MEFVKAVDSKHISEMIEADVVNALVKITYRAYTELGQVPAGRAEHFNTHLVFIRLTFDSLSFCIRLNIVCNLKRERMWQEGESKGVLLNP